jgi:uncharacterized protein (TIGR04255 family)
MKRRYLRPPIIEAVCEIHFALREPFTPEQIAKLEPVWKSSLPQIHINEEKGMTLLVGPDGVNVQQQTQGKRLVARSEDGTRLAQLSSQFLAVNQLKPYPGWSENFRDEIHLRLKEVTSHLPVDSVNQINLRYIDRLDFPQVPLQWSEWFTFCLPVPSSIPSAGGTAQFHLEQMLPEGLALSLHLVSVPPTAEGHTSVIYDNAIVWRGTAPLTECANLLERVHEPHPRIFDDFLTRKSQELFEAYDV